MAVELPPTTTALANQLIVFLTTPPAASSGIPTVAEVNAGLAAQCFIYGNFNVTPTQNTGEGPRKNCRPNAPTNLGIVTYPATELQYSYMPQELGAPGADGNELYEALEPGAVITAVVLDGISGETESVAAGDVADVYEMKAGVRRKGQTGDGEFDEKSVTQALVVVGGGPVVEDHPLAAA
ncbi:hypothetical protein [Microbacterium sp.]|uniref:phage tail tube protein n=1 Tax=Microbacterium sp. TaxID=51671 RepID=UPI0037363428